MDGKITLSDICDELYRQKQETGELPLERTKEQRKDFLSRNRKYLIEIFKTMQIMKYLKYVKPEFDIDANGYEFSDKSRGFLVDLLDKYTNKNILELRRGHLDKVSDRCIVWMVEGLYNMFKYNDVPEDILKQIGITMSNFTDYPVRLRYGKVFQLTYDLEQLANRSFWPKWKTYLGGNDNCVWLDAMQADLRLFIIKWKYIYDSMSEGRQLEVDSIAEYNYECRNPDNDIRAEIEFVLAEELNTAMKNDVTLKKLEDELNKEVIYKKTGCYVDKIDSFEYMKKRISKKREEIEKEVIEKHYNGISIPQDDDLVTETDFNNMKSSRSILEEAIEEYQQSLLPIPKLELPNIDIDQVIDQFKTEQMLKKKEE